ncbi:MAG: hypothetical protein K2K16_09655 [Ruminococcus sp.]|nr:hypothetical protein [Ruminococcus sp.]
MKKIISFLIAISFLASYSPVCSYADDTDTTDLYALASSLGVETLSEITYSEEVDKVITGYQCSQGYTYFDYYEKFLMTSNSYEQQIDLLLETAENSMKDNKYFWLVIRSEKFSHAVCGMGIADGDWEWNGKKYDKCILTLDSNSADADRNACACIYINSETKECLYTGL